MPMASCIYSSAGPELCCNEPQYYTGQGVNNNITSHLSYFLLADAPATHVKSNNEVTRQRNAKRMKVGIARELGEKKTADKIIERTFFSKLFNSENCMKGNPKVVEQKLKYLKSESAKRDALKNDLAGGNFTSL